MLEHRAGPITLIEEIVSPTQSEIRDNRDCSENDSVEIKHTYHKNYAGKETCTSCGGTGEDSDRYESMFDIYAPCGTCHGEGVV